MPRRHHAALRSRYAMIDCKAFDKARDARRIAIRCGRSLTHRAQVTSPPYGNIRVKDPADGQNSSHPYEQTRHRKKANTEPPTLRINEVKTERD